MYKFKTIIANSLMSLSTLALILTLSWNTLLLFSMQKSPSVLIALAHDWHVVMARKRCFSPARLNPQAFFTLSLCLSNNTDQKPLNLHIQVTTTALHLSCPDSGSFLQSSTVLMGGN